MGKKQQQQQFFKVLLTRNIDSRGLKSLEHNGFEPGEHSTISILKEIDGTSAALIVKGNIKGNKNLMFEAIRPMIDAIFNHTYRNEKHKPNKRQRQANRERKAEAFSTPASKYQTEPKSPESPPTTSSSTTDSVETTPEKPSSLKPTPDIIPAQPTQMRNYYTHDYMRQHHQQQQLSRQEQQPGQQQLSQQEQQPSQQQQLYQQQPSQQQQLHQKSQQQYQQMEGSNTHKHSEYQNYYNQLFENNRYYTNNDQYIPYDHTNQLYVHTNQYYSIYPEYTPSTNDLVQTAQPHNNVTNHERRSNQQVRPENLTTENKNPAKPDSTENGGDNPMQHGSSYQPENRSSTNGGVPNQHGKPSTYGKWMNCQKGTKRMNTEYNENQKKPKTIGKKIKMSDNDHFKPNYEDISDNETSPTTAKATSEEKTKETPPAQKTEDYPENVLKSAGLPKLNQQK